MLVSPMLPHPSPYRNAQPGGLRLDPSPSGPSVFLPLLWRTSCGPTAIGLCLLAFIQPVQAQSSGEMILYGIVDTGIGYTAISQKDLSTGSENRRNRFGMSSGAQSGSRWGIRLTESLNHEARVIGVMEQGLFSNAGELAQNGIFFGRQSTLGIESRRWGRLDFGRQINLASNYFLGVDPFVLGFGQANMGASFGAADTFRYDNLLLYQTPKRYPWQFGIGYSFNVGASAVYLNSPNPSVLPRSNYFGSQNNLRALTLGARYQSETLTLVTTFDAAQPPDKIPAGQTPYPLTPNTEAPTLKQWILGASFKTHPKSSLTWAAAIGQSFNGAFSGQTPGNNFIGTGLPTDTLGAQILFASGYNTASYLLGVTWQIDSVQQVFASWQAIAPRMNIPTVAPLAFAQTASVAYTYNLSVQTNFYAWASAGNNFQLFAGSKAFEIGMGLRHLF